VIYSDIYHQQKTTSVTVLRQSAANNAKYIRITAYSFLKT